MFENSKDILYLVISFCVLWVTVFLCWMFYQAMRLLRNANQIVEEFRVRLQGLMDTVNHIRARVEQLSSLLTLVNSGAAGLAKKIITKKAGEWLDRGTKTVNKTAKEAVQKAVAETAKKMKKAAKK